MNQEAFTSNKPYLFRAIYEWLLDNDATPYILVDATVSGVEVPSEHVQNGQIVLNASPSAIRNWFVDNDALSFNARFSGKSQQIYVPMNAILAIYAQENGLGMAFPNVEEGTEESVNESDSSEITATEIEAAQAEEEIISEKKPFEPEVIDSDRKPESTVRGKSKNTSHLKVVK